MGFGSQWRVKCQLAYSEPEAETHGGRQPPTGWLGGSQWGGTCGVSPSRAPVPPAPGLQLSDQLCTQGCPRHPQLPGLGGTGPRPGGTGTFAEGQGRSQAAQARSQDTALGKGKGKLGLRCLRGLDGGQGDAAPGFT